MKSTSLRLIRPLFLSIARILAAAAMLFIVLVTGCQSKLIYFPRPYGPATPETWRKETSGRFMDFQTSQGSQRAFLQGELKQARNLWIVCGGNGSLALDWSEWLVEHGPKQDAWLLVDFPGYGNCQGAPNPERIRESFRTVIPLAAKELGWNQAPDPAKLRFFGHSLGGAACLIAASEFKIQRGVLIAPFTSTMEMSRVLTGLPVGFLVWHRFDNVGRMDELAKRGPGSVYILHGVNDEVIPVDMSRRLAKAHPEIVHLTEVPNGFHNDIQSNHADFVADALEITGKQNAPSREGRGVER